MPEGDTLHNLAARLHAQLTGRPIRAAMARDSTLERGLTGTSVVATGAVGKNLLLRLSDGSVLRVHLGMQGEWRTISRDRAGAAIDPMLSLRLDTDEHRHTLLRAKHLERLALADLARHPSLSRLGPDLCLPQVDLDVVLSRARALGPDLAVAQLLMHQGPACGVGNVYKNEALFCERIHPATPAGALSDDALRRLYHRAHTLLRHNLHPGVRSTTGRSDPRTWVYERAGRSCLVCGGAVTAYEDPADQRWTWWCPTCQPLPHRSGTST